MAARRGSGGGVRPSDQGRRSTAGPRVRGPATLVGVGLGGFVDGIVLHQMLQWHHMLTGTEGDTVGIRSVPADTLAGLETNTLWDGFFHAAAWLCVVGGLAWLWRRLRAARREPGGATPPGARVLWGALLTGWGLFNLVEGIVDHHLLQIHHVRSGPDQLAWDLAFLALGAALVVGGLLLQRSGLRRDGGPVDTSR
jgi:uncharacterized membrane protein